MNFTYVNRPLGLNNEAYEVIRDLKTSSTTTRESRRQEEKRKTPRYTEVAEHEGLLSSSEDDGEDVSDEELKGGEFDLELPVSLQMVLGVTQLRLQRQQNKTKTFFKMFKFSGKNISRGGSILTELNV